MAGVAVFPIEGIVWRGESFKEKSTAQLNERSEETARGASPGNVRQNADPHFHRNSTFSKIHPATYPP